MVPGMGRLLLLLEIMCCVHSKQITQVSRALRPRQALMLPAESAALATCVLLLSDGCFMW